MKLQDACGIGNWMVQWKGRLGGRRAGQGVRREARSLADSPALTCPTTEGPKVLLLRNVCVVILFFTV